ncbi:MAG TPA: carbon-nitrogen hydrolase family protein, partial [Chloroflexota bacterium]|nr:carbon-nitrogen hydrolase family protein [Chloroflexota bacterium]
SMKLTVATCQFPVDADIGRNCDHTLRLMRTAKARGATVAHFCECSLSGYATADIESTAAIDWDLLSSASNRVLEAASQLGIWVIFGSTHRLSGSHRPHNSLFIVDPRGAIIDRYDKRFCAGADENSGELAQYSPGDHTSVFSIEGIRCGTLVCHEYRYPELYRQYKQLGVQLVFHSFHAAHVSPESAEAGRAYVGSSRGFGAGASLPEITMPATMKAAAAANHLWISCPNSSARESCWPSFFVRPDGVITGRLRRHMTGMLISEVDTEQDLYDSTAAWRDRAMRGILHSGNLVQDRRSRVRTEL